jgi:hypothetical protein
MNTKTNITALGILLAGSLVGMQSVQAQNGPLECGDPGFTMQHWLDTDGGCTVGDKVWTLLETAGFDPRFIEVGFTDLGAQLAQIIDLAPPGAPWTEEGLFTFSYTGVITDPDRYFTGVALDADISILPGQLADTNVVKVVSDMDDNVLATLQTFGAPTNSPLLKWVQAIRVDETVEVLNRPIVSVSNTFAQAEIPEPISTTLIGAGLIGLAALRRRRSAKA